MKDDYTRNATVVRVIDGDTVALDVDLGFYVSVRMSCRLAGLNARELRDAGGPEARDHLARLLPVGQAVVVRSVEADKYAGRFIAVIVRNGESVNGRLLAEDWAAPYDGHGLTSEHVPPWPRP